MEPTTEQEILKALKGLNLRIDEQESNYCNAKQATIIMSLAKHEQLQWLVENNYLLKYPRGNGFRYRKTECRKVAEMIDREEIKIPTFSKQ